MSRLSQSSARSSDYYDDDPELLSALQNAVLPGDADYPVDNDEKPLTPPPSTQPSLKRRHHDINEEESGNDKEVDLGKEGEDTGIYGPSHFDGFGEYMSRKRAKLQIQNERLAGSGSRDLSGSVSGIFTGLSIYINGYTQPSVQDLRALIVKHGGIFQPYLDKKGLVTHILSDTLTPAKQREFQHMKVVKPAWIVQSAEMGLLLPWVDFRFQVNTRSEAQQGVITSQSTISSKALPASITKSSKPLSVSHSTSNKGANPKAEIPSYAANPSNVTAAHLMSNPTWRQAHTSASSDFIQGYYKNSRLHHLSTWKSELKELVAEASRRAGKKLPAPHVGDDLVETGERRSDGTLSMCGSVLRSPFKGVIAQKPPVDLKGKSKAVDEVLGKHASVENMDKIFMHCDFDAFFVSAGLTKRIGLKGRPVVVCHSQGSSTSGTNTSSGIGSTSEVASCSYEARQFGIKNGMSLNQAKQLCPKVVTIPYEFELYKQISLKFYTVLMTLADDLQAVSVDEAMIEVTKAVTTFAAENPPPQATPRDPAKDFAEHVRVQMRIATDCEVSIGIAHNPLLARLATRRAKPAASFHLLPSQDVISTFLAPLSLSDLPGFGHSLTHKAQEKLGTTLLGDLVQKSRAVLCDALGKTFGERLYWACRGVDLGGGLEPEKERKSVSCEINYGIRFENNEQAEKFVYQLAREVSKRLKEITMVGRVINLKVMKRDPTAPVEPPKFLGHGKCHTFNKQGPLVDANALATADEAAIGERAWRMLKSLNHEPKELRGIGIHIQKLEPGKSTNSPSKPVQRLLPVSALPPPPLPVVKPVSALPKTSVPALQEKGKGRATSVNATAFDPPAFSQVDPDVWSALPDDMKKELENEFKRRSEPTSAPPVARQAFAFPAPHAKRPVQPKSNGKKQFPAGPAGRAGKPNILEQLLVASKGNVKDPDKRKGTTSMQITDDDLIRLGFDPEVYHALPRKVKAEQTIRVRMMKNMGHIPKVTWAGPGGGGEKKILKPKRKSRLSSRFKRPKPKAKYPEIPVLRRKGTEPEEVVKMETIEDVLDVIGQWVNRHAAPSRRSGPRPKDVDMIQSYLLKCVSGQGEVPSTPIKPSQPSQWPGQDLGVSYLSGMERAVTVMKWWQVLLRRHWGSYEIQSLDPEALSDDEEEDPISKNVAKEWWGCFVAVRKEVDKACMSRFGGRLSLR